MALPLTTDWLIERYLFGVDLTDDAGEPYPDSHYSHALLAGQEWCKKAIDIELEETTVVERHDWEPGMWDQWCLLQLRRRPVISIESIKFKYGANNTLLTVPDEWILSVVEGQVQLIPLSSVQYQAATGYGVVPWIGPGIGAGARTVPGYFEVTYKAGFPAWRASGLSAVYDAPTGFGGLVNVSLSKAAGTGGATVTIEGSATDGAVAETVTFPEGSSGPIVSQKTWDSVDSITPDDLPAGGKWGVRAVKIHTDVLHVIGSYAAVLPLNTAGDLIAGAGIASKSIGLDGLSTSINTTASAENTGYGARVRQHLDDVKRLVPVLRRFYHGPTLRVG